MTRTYILRPYKAFYAISFCLAICCILSVLVAFVCFISYGIWEMLCALGVLLIPVLILFYFAHKANRIVVAFDSFGFEIRNDHGATCKKCWSDYKGIYWEYSSYGHHYILIFPNALTEAAQKRICNRAEFRLKCTTVLDDGFAIADPLCRGKKYSDMIPFSPQ